MSCTRSILLVNILLEEEKCIEGLVRKYVGKRSIGKLRNSWKENIKVDFRELDWEGVNKRLGLEESNKLQGPMNLEVLREQLMNPNVLKKESVPCSWLVDITFNIATLSELQDPYILDTTFRLKINIPVEWACRTYGSGLVGCALHGPRVWLLSMFSRLKRI
jgi:hypothetical protein